METTHLDPSLKRDYRQAAAAFGIAIAVVVFAVAAWATYPSGAGAYPPPRAFPPRPQPPEIAASETHFSGPARFVRLGGIILNVQDVRWVTRSEGKTLVYAAGLRDVIRTDLQPHQVLVILNGEKDPQLDDNLRTLFRDGPPRLHPALTERAARVLAGLEWDPRPSRGRVVAGVKQLPVSGHKCEKCGAVMP